MILRDQQKRLVEQSLGQSVLICNQKELRGRIESPQLAHGQRISQQELPGRIGERGSPIKYRYVMLPTSSVSRAPVVVGVPGSQAAGVLEAEAACESASPTHQASGLIVDSAPSRSPAPSVRAAAVAHGPAGSNKRSDWRSTGARPRGRRILPPDLFSDSECDNGNEDPAFCEGASSGTPPLNHSSDDITMVQSNAVLDRKRDHYACPECGRSFMSKIGLSQHRRRAHIEAYNADIDIERTRPRCTREDEYLLTAHEVQLFKEGVQNINQRLARIFPTRTFDGIRSHRRQVQYQNLVKDLQFRNDGDDQSQAVSEFFVNVYTGSGRHRGTLHLHRWTIELS
ncbi:hypothetical protein MRX96_025736 [Rhipicephalus microplus]